MSKLDPKKLARDIEKNEKLIFKMREAKKDLIGAQSVDKAKKEAEKLVEECNQKANKILADAIETKRNADKELKDAQEVKAKSKEAYAEAERERVAAEAIRKEAENTLTRAEELEKKATDSNKMSIAAKEAYDEKLNEVKSVLKGLADG